jgi:protein-S-isoprenylcysteine O-methyltransferase Ste14
MSIIGKEPTTPFIFYSGKIAGYILWFLFLCSLFDVINLRMVSFKIFNYISYCTVILGMIFTFISLINLGKSTRLGLPSEKTIFIQKGIYKISRNPMYVGFNLFTISSIFQNANIIVLILGIYSIYSYHLIIKGEENFLEKRFRKQYLDYKKRVNRYL